ncbi:MAG: hypothetical protein IJE12_10040 [Prevotella sp.]|nr:hypothetical protein [Prevotella sp.]
MAETRFHDCPKCGKENVVGYLKEDGGAKVGKVVSAGGLALSGALIGGPLGALAGLAIGKWYGDKVTQPHGWTDFVFKCPRCNHEFTESFKM